MSGTNIGVEERSGDPMNFQIFVLNFSSKVWLLPALQPAYMARDIKNLPLILRLILFRQRGGPLTLMSLTQP